MEDFIDLDEPETTGAEHSALVVQTKLPAEVVVIHGDVMAKVTQLREQAGALKVKDDESNTQAAIYLQDITTLGAGIEKARKQVKAPYLNAGREIDAAAAKALALIDSAKGLLKGSIADYTKQQAAEQKRREEEARKQREAEEAAKQEAEAAEAAGEDFLDLDFDEQPEATSEAKPLAKPAAKLPDGITMRKTLYPIVEDFAKIPDELKVLNDALVKSQYCKGWKDGDPFPAVPGIRFEVDAQPISTGKRK
ncbi:hypothetical protein [Cerasicoccus frondis]|uniref:hypothetical protein n=1 Tax=Cerasicoccus frondis TaxID=490090 RepID=UPI002852B30E|nr:hypothetical protein [Cerasicoccus frondis]